MGRRGFGCAGTTIHQVSRHLEELFVFLRWGVKAGHSRGGVAIVLFRRSDPTTTTHILDCGVLSHCLSASCRCHLLRVLRREGCGRGGGWVGEQFCWSAHNASVSGYAHVVSWKSVDCASVVLCAANTNVVGA